MDLKYANQDLTNRTAASAQPRRSGRWAPDSPDKAGVVGFSTAITSTMTAEQLEAYVMAFRVEEISQNLHAGNVVPATRRGRSPSPEPEYDGAGRRTNTRPERYRKRLEDERHRLVEAAMRTIPNYRPPYDYRRPTAVFREKLYVPADEHPHVGFIGQILGPRGNSLKKMNTESGADIVVRGRGSVKEGRGTNRSNKQGSSNDLSEPLHCLITADSQQKINKAKELLNTVIHNAISAPEYDNDRKRQQLRDLAMMNGTFRDDERHLGSGRLIQFPGNASPQVYGSLSSNSKRSHGTMMGHDDSFDDEYLKLIMDVSGNTNSDNVSQQATGDSIPPWRRMRH